MELSPPFKAAVFYTEGLKLTEMILEDTCIVWEPWGRVKSHSVMLGYDAETRSLVGIQIWDDVRVSRYSKSGIASKP